MTRDFPDKSVARDDVAFDNFAQIFELIVANYQSLANCRTCSLFLLDDVNMVEVLFEELPS